MANIPQKSPDLAEDALNAIQEALAAGQSERRSAAAAAPANESNRSQIPAPPATDLFVGAAGGGRCAAAPRRQ